MMLLGRKALDLSLCAKQQYAIQVMEFYAIFEEASNINDIFFRLIA